MIWFSVSYVQNAFDQWASIVWWRFIGFESINDGDEGRND